MGRLKSLSRLSFLSLLVLVLGFAREVLIAREFGLSADLDVYIAVSGLYLFLGQQMGNAMEMTLISQWPRLEGEGPGGRRVIELAFQNSLLVLILVLVLYSVFDELFVLVFPALGGRVESAREIFVALVPATLLAANAGLFKGALNTQGIFSPGMLAGAIVSVAVMSSLFILPADIGVLAIVCGLVLGQCLVAAWYFSLLWKRGIVGLAAGSVHGLFRPDRIFWLALVVVIAGELVYQVLGLSQRSLASALGEGTVSALYYATSLMLVPLMLVITPALTMIYPGMARRLQEDRSAGIAMLKQAMVLLAAICSVAALSIVVLADDLVRIVYVRGAFTPQDAILTASILKILVLAMPLMVVSRLARYALYSLSDYLMPVVGNVVNIGALLLSASISIPKYGIVGLAGSIVVSTGLSAVFLLSVLYFRCRHGQVRDPSV